MSVLLAGTIGILVAVGVLQLLQRDIIRIVVGLYTLWNALNLFVIATASMRGTRAPLDDLANGSPSDPLVQALVLTAIVITFGFTALLVTLIVWVSRRTGSIDIRDCRESRELVSPARHDRQSERPL